jgi:hypothetical protein
VESSVQANSREPFYAWLALAGVLVWAIIFLIGMRRYLSQVHEEDRIFLHIFALSAAICVALMSHYLLYPHRRGRYGIHRAGAALGGLTAISLTVPVFGPLIEIQIRFLLRMATALNLIPLAEMANNILFIYSLIAEIVLFGMAAGWISVMIGSKLIRTRNRPFEG